MLITCLAPKIAFKVDWVALLNKILNDKLRRGLFNGTR